MEKPLIVFTEKGMYCPQGDFYIDPWQAVAKAVITHAHSDHARPGSLHYLAHTQSEAILKQRLGASISLQTLAWQAPIDINGVKLSLHPAGHIAGSSMVRLQAGSQTWLITGDYKLENDGISGAWEPVACTHMVTECTFGLPIYQWQPQEQVYAQMRQWVSQNHQAGICSVFYAYSLGKAQRIVQALATLDIPILAHGAVYLAHEAVRASGIALPVLERITPQTTKAHLKGAIVLAPPGAQGTPWLKRLTPYADAACSGWMQVRGNKRRNNTDNTFVLSDHADWPGLLQAIKACQPAEVFATHGFTETFSRYLKETYNLKSSAVTTQFGQEEPLEPETA
ncbi:MAG TPA: ligase-associated DNA damage response exonuclease [Phnomibacter sp.]|nr:ligase-associated DNA damage response exonuclease [Phnomibacter sp.]